MISFPPCKINLGLNVVSKRADGYHNLETCFYPLPWTDVLEVIPADQFSFTSSGNAIPGNVEDNLCVKAYALLKKDYQLPPVSIYLHKVIPSGAGLGGGSSDAAHMLLLLNDVFNLSLSAEKLNDYALKLGSDCPFFIINKPMMGTGRGEILEAVELNLSGKFIVVVKPDVHVSTGEAYAGVTPSTNKNPIRNVIENNPVSAWKSNLKNDFEDSVFRKHSVIYHIKEELYGHRAVYASMSGSGSAVYGIFEEPVELKKLFPGMIYWSTIL